MGHDSKQGSIFNFRDYQLDFRHFKVQRRDRTEGDSRNRENPHRSMGMNIGKDFLFSEKGCLAIKPCCRPDCTNNALLSTGNTKNSKDNFQRGLQLDKAGCCTKISRMCLISDLWCIFFLLLLLRIYEMIQQTIAVWGLLSPAHLSGQYQLIMTDKLAQKDKKHQFMLLTISISNNRFVLQGIRIQLNQRL